MPTETEWNELKKEQDNPKEDYLSEFISDNRKELESEFIDDNRMDWYIRQQYIETHETEWIAFCKNAYKEYVAEISYKHSDLRG